MIPLCKNGLQQILQHVFNIFSNAILNHKLTMRNEVIFRHSTSHKVYYSLTMYKITECTFVITVQIILKKEKQCVQKVLIQTQQYTLTEGLLHFHSLKIKPLFLTKILLSSESHDTLEPAHTSAQEPTVKFLGNFQTSC